MKMIMTAMLLAFMATAAEPSRLTSVKAMFDSGIKKLEAEHKQKVKLYSQKYLAELDRIQTASTRAGDLDGALQVRAEILRVKQRLAGKTPAVRVVVPTAAGKPAGSSHTLKPVSGVFQPLTLGARIFNNPDAASVFAHVPEELAGKHYLYTSYSSIGVSALEDTTVYVLPTLFPKFWDGGLKDALERYGFVPRGEVFLLCAKNGDESRVYTKMLRKGEKIILPRWAVIIAD